MHGVANAALHLSVGSRVQVYWPDDAAWYTGTVSELNGVKGVIDYDDGDIEELDLDKEQLRLLGEGGDGGASSSPDGEGKRKRHKPATFGNDQWLTEATPARGGAPAGALGAPSGGGPLPHGFSAAQAAAGGGDGGAGVDTRLLVRFANPHAGKGEAGESPKGANAGPVGGSAAVPRTGAPPKHGGGGGGSSSGARPSGHGAPGRSHQKKPAAPPPAWGGAAGAQASRDRGVPADGARALLGMHDAGPAFSGKPYCAADAAAVRAWLEEHGMGKYAPLFDANEVDMATLPYLTLQDLRDLPIHAVGPRRKLLAALERM